MSGPSSILVPTVALLKEVRLLQVLTEQELSELVTLGAPANYEAFSNVVIEGELSWGIFFIVEGTVGILKANKVAGTLYEVGQLHRGNFFGEMSLVDDKPRSATVRSLTSCKLFFISKQIFMSFIKQDQHRAIRFFESCVKNLVQRLRELDDEYIVTQYQLWKTALHKGKAG